MNIHIFLILLAITDAIIFFIYSLLDDYFNNKIEYKIVKASIFLVITIIIFYIFYIVFGFTQDNDEWRPLLQGKQFKR